MFRILQLVERQVVLFDALEDTAFSEINDLNGPRNPTHLINKVEDRQAAEKLAEFLQEYSIRIVLTAHPTQFYPNAVLGIINDLSAAIAKSDIAEIKNLLVQLSRTKFKNPQKPTPHQEALSIIWYLKSCFYKTMPEIQKRLEKPLVQNFPLSLRWDFGLQATAMATPL